MSGTALWAAVVAGSLGCYLLKLAGLSVPAAWVDQPWVARIVDFVPAALLAALVAVQAVAAGNDLVLDGRLVGLAVAALRWRCGRRSSSSSCWPERPARSCTFSPPDGFRTVGRPAARGRAGTACAAARRRSRSGCRRPRSPGGTGTTIAIGLRPFAAPTAWAPPGSPTAFAT